MQVPTQAPGISASRVALVLFASLVFALTWAGIASAIVYAVVSPSVLTITLGLIALGLGFLVRPRYRRRPNDALDLADYPHLNAAINATASQLQAPRPGAVAITHHFNASVYKYGLFGREYALELGLPLFVALTPGEQAAVLAHEIAHQVCGDPTRDRIVSTAILTLTEVHDLVAPTEHLLSGGVTGVPEILGNLARRALAIPIQTLLKALWNLAAGDHRRSEFYADLLAARTSGREAAVSALVRTESLTPLFITVARQSALQRDGHGPLSRFRERLLALGDGEHDELLAGALHAPSDLPSSHPHLSQRIEFISQFGPEHGTLASHERPGDLLAELATLEHAVDRRIIDEVRFSLYA